MFLLKSSMGAIIGALTMSSLTTMAMAECSRDTLIAAADTYIGAQSSGKLDDLQKLFDSSFTYQENNKKAEIKSGLLSKALKLDHNRTTADTTACATFTELVSTAGPYVIGTQLRHTTDGAKLTMVDTIAATKGSWSFDAAKTLPYFQKEDWGTLDPSKRSTRAVLQAAADAYLDMWSDASAKNKVPWGTPCERTEGSMHVSPCTVGAPANGGTTKNTMRRYVIDETVGSCDVLCAFGGSMPDSHELRLESGKVRFVHTITV